MKIKIHGVFDPKDTIISWSLHFNPDPDLLFENFHYQSKPSVRSNLKVEKKVYLEWKNNGF